LLQLKLTIFLVIIKFILILFKFSLWKIGNEPLSCYLPMWISRMKIPKMLAKEEILLSVESLFFDGIIYNTT